MSTNFKQMLCFPCGEPIKVLQQRETRTLNQSKSPWGTLSCKSSCFTCKATGMRALRPGGPIRHLAIDGTLNHTRSIHLPLLFKIKLKHKRLIWFHEMCRVHTIAQLYSKEQYCTSSQNLRSTDLPSLRTQSSMRVLMPLPHTARSLSWHVLQSTKLT